MTAKEMCEYIAKWLNESGKGPVVDAEQIWNSSLEDGLWQVVDWYETAHIDQHGRLSDRGAQAVAGWMKLLIPKPAEKAHTN